MEAAIFAGDLYKMYCRFAERQNWGVELLSQNEGDKGGYKLVVMKITGDRAFQSLNLNLEHIEYKEFQKPNHKEESIPQQQQLP